MAQEQTASARLRAARHAGFENSLKHLPADRQKRLKDIYVPQDTRRERNISTFVKGVKGQ